MEFRYLHPNPYMGNSPAWGKKTSKCLNSFSSHHWDNRESKERPSRGVRAPCSSLSSAATQLWVTRQEHFCCVHTPSAQGSGEAAILARNLASAGGAFADLLAWRARAAQARCAVCPTPAGKRLCTTNPSALVGTGCVMSALRSEGHQRARGRLEFRQTWQGSGPCTGTGEAAPRVLCSVRGTSLQEGH